MARLYLADCSLLVVGDCYTANHPHETHNNGGEWAS